MRQIEEKDYQAALAALSQNDKGTLLTAAKRNHNTAQQIRDAIIDLLEDLALGGEQHVRLGYVLEDVVAAEIEARAQYEVLKTLLGKAL